MKQKRINYVTDGLSGSIGKLVFREVNGYTIVAKRPIRTAPNTVLQEAVISTFKMAVMYAKSILLDPLIKAAYKAKAKGLQHAYHIAVGDYFKAPVIHDIDLSQLGNAASRSITALVTDDFKVKWVKVRIEAASGNLLEEGDAQLQPDGLHWSYTVNAANANNAGNKVVVSATDLPGNLITQIKTV